MDRKTLERDKLNENISSTINKRYFRGVGGSEDYFPLFPFFYILK